MDIKETITELVEKITNDKSLKKSFKKDPTETVKSLVGNLPKDQIEAIVQGILAKVDLSKLGGLFSKLFGKKKKK